MSGDYYKGQNVACVVVIPLHAWVVLSMAGEPAPRYGAAYVVDDVSICEDCQRVGIALVGMGNVYYPADWFQPIEPREMQKLRALLVPSSGTLAPA